MEFILLEKVTPMLTFEKTYWCVVQTQVNCEFKAQLHLENQGYVVFAPKYKKTISHARKKTDVIRPLFPRYIFICIDFSKDRWRSIRSTFGVASLIMSGDFPSQIPDNIIEGLRNRSDHFGNITLAPKQTLKIGDQVKVLNGVFEESLGLIESVKDQNRVIMLLTFLNRELRATVTTDTIVKI